MIKSLEQRNVFSNFQEVRNRCTDIDEPFGEIFFLFNNTQIVNSFILGKREKNHVVKS